MKKESKYCIACKKVEARDECSFGPEVWDLCSVKSKVVSEASKREKIANALLGATFALSAAQSPGAALMEMWAKKRGKAGVDYLDNGRVSHPSRNRKRKLKEGKIPWSRSIYPGKSGWTPEEKNRAKMKSLEREVKGPSPSPDAIRRYKGLMAAHETQSKDTSNLPRHISRLEKLHGINIGRERRSGRNSQEKLMPSRFSKNLPSNKKRNKYYQSNLKAPRVPLGEEIDKKMLMMMVKKLMDEKKRKNYLLNYGYIGEAKTPAWSRSEGKDLVKGGLNRKGIASYRRENPGSKLSMAVTTDPSKLKKGSKSWKRRKSFCSRSAGQMRMWPKAAKDPNSRLRLARRKWNC